MSPKTGTGCRWAIDDAYWFSFTYAARFYKQTTTSSPELKKLVALFAWLDDVRNDRGGQARRGRKRSAATAGL